uniref:Uncharacterized protein n=1 Tax=Neogobius melanostomus TaxID=47308 RepID=A0A8C6TH75_9GOBI
LVMYIFHSLSLLDHQSAPDTFHVSAGHLAVLSCSPAQQHRTNVSWSRDGQGLDRTLGVEVQEGKLWFKPAHTSHSGVYTCHYSGQNQAQVQLSVSGEKCPFVAEHRPLHLGENVLIPWAHVVGRGFLKITNVTPGDAGTYTCFIDLSVGGQNYSAAWSVEMTLTNGMFLQSSSSDTFQRKGRSVELRCLADLGYSEDSHVHMYWLLNYTHTENYPERRRVKGVSTLVISEVHQELLNISISCCVKNAVGEDYGQLWLTQGHLLHFTMLLSLSLALLLLAAFMYCCRVELVLASRDLRSRFSNNCVHDGKLYDGLVSCLLFSLQVLPQHLEGQWGYRLYVPGRDDCPGEAIHEALSEAVRKSRRLLLLLCGSGTQGPLSSSEELQPLCFEQEVGLYDALTHKELRVILIEIGGPVDYSCLPESVQYLRRTQGALRWRPRGRLGLLLRPERCFWNGLRYHMPPVPPGRGAHSGPGAKCGLQGIFCGLRDDFLFIL